MGVDARMLVKIRPVKRLSKKDVTRLAADLRACVGGAVSVYRDATWYADKADRHCLQLVKRWTQDGPTIRPKPGEQFINVRLSSRYYGKGYERGHLPGIIEVAMWLEARLAPQRPEIWYGGDSSGVLAEPFGPEERQALYAYYVEHGHTPYVRGRVNPDDVLTCDFCAGREMVWCGGGAGATYHVCDGCGWRVQVDEQGVITPHRSPFDDDDDIGTTITPLKRLAGGEIAVVRGHAFVDSATGRITVLRTVRDILDLQGVTDADLRASAEQVVAAKGGLDAIFEWHPGSVDPAVANVLDAILTESHRRKESQP